MRRNREAWDVAAHKYVQESAALLTSEPSLTQVEEALLASLVVGARVVHLQSGHGLDDHDLLRLGAREVVGVDFSQVTALAAAGRTEGRAISYVVGDVLAVPLRSGCADVVYTGKGAHMWLPNLSTWAEEVQRLLSPAGHFVMFDAHPASVLWGDSDGRLGVPQDADYFGGERVNRSFPASALARFSNDPQLTAVERQWTVADLVMALIRAGLTLRHLGEHPEPFWQPEAAEAPPWLGQVPNSLSLWLSR